MARMSVTYEQVAAAATALVAAGVDEPGARAVREELAKKVGPGEQVGSPNTIQRHLESWRANGRPGVIVPAMELPPQLASTLGVALANAATEARRPLEVQLSQVKAELAELVAHGEACDARADELISALAARTSERDVIAGNLQARDGQIQALRDELEAMKGRHAQLEGELLNARASVRAAEARVDEVRSLWTERFIKVESELVQARAGAAESEDRARAAAERAAAAAARLEEINASRGELDRQVNELRRAAGSLQADAGRQLAAEAEAAGLREQVVLLKQTAETMRGLLSGVNRQNLSRPEVLKP